MLENIAKEWLRISSNLNIYEIFIIDALYIEIVIIFLLFWKWLFPFINIKARTEIDENISVYTIAINALIEEFIFRYLFLVPILIFNPNDNVLLLLVSIISSIIFGWIHGNFIYIFTIGLSGFIYCTFFIITFQKYGVMSAIYYVFILHFFYNYMLKLIKIMYMKF